MTDTIVEDFELGYPVAEMHENYPALSANAIEALISLIVVVSRRVEFL